MTGPLPSVKALCRQENDMTDTTCVECPHSRHLDGQCQDADLTWMGHSSVPIPCECAGDLDRRAHQYGVELAAEVDAQPLSELLAAAWLDGHAVAVESMLLSGVPDLTAHLEAP